MTCGVSADRSTLNMDNPVGVMAQSAMLQFSHVSIKQEAEHSLKSRLVCERYFMSSSILFAEGAAELIHLGVDSACHPSEVGEMSASVYW